MAQVLAHAEMETKRNEDNKLIQQLLLVDDDGNLSREFYLTVEQARNVLQNFEFENNKRYIVSTLTPYGWKSTRAFTYNNGSDIVNKIYSEDHEIEHYDYIETISNDKIHVYSIAVEEL